MNRANIGPWPAVPGAHLQLLWEGFTQGGILVVLSSVKEQIDRGLSRQSRAVYYDHCTVYNVLLLSTYCSILV